MIQLQKNNATDCVNMTKEARISHRAPCLIRIQYALIVALKQQVNQWGNVANHCVVFLDVLR